MLWGYQVLIPTKLRKRVMEELYESHPVVKIKALARSHIWWGRVYKTIEEKAKACSACQSSKNALAKPPLHPWSWASSPWERNHIDFAGPFLGKMFLVVTESHSK